MDRKKARKYFGLPQDKILVGAAANGGTLSNQWKGGEYTLAAVELIKESCPDVCFVDIGGTSKQSDPKHLSIPHISGESRLALAYNALDIFLYTPKADNCPLVVLEAMACEIPVVCFNIGGLPELVADKETGYVTTFQDIKEIVQATLRLIRSPSERTRMGINARKRVKNHFDQSLIPAKYLQAYEKAITQFNTRKNQFGRLKIDDLPDYVKTAHFIDACRVLREEKPVTEKASYLRKPKSKQCNQTEEETRPVITSIVDVRTKSILQQDQTVENCEACINFPVISIITPSFNQAEYLENCIISVLSQDYPKIEYIIMDGGSTDGSRDIIEKYADRLTYWQSKPDKGHYCAVHEGIERSTGEIITWLNSDDQFHPNAFRVAAAIFLQRSDVAWITGRSSILNHDGTKVFKTATLPIWSRKRYMNNRYHHPFIQQEGTFWRRDLYRKAGSYIETKLELAGDMELWTRFFRHEQLHSVDFSFASYRTHNNNRALIYMKEYLEEAASVIKEERRLVEEVIYPKVLSAPEPITKEQIHSYLQKIAFSGKNEDSSTDSDPEISTDNNNNMKTALNHNDGKTKGYKQRNRVKVGDQSIILTAIVSTFNAQRFIRGCLEDLTNQTIASQMEIIVVDSASEQNEASIVKEFQERFDNIKYIRTPLRENVYAAWNRGIRFAKGKYVTNANTDDRHRLDALEIMVNTLESNPEIALVYADVIKTETENETFNACTPTGMFKWHDWDRKILLEKGCFIGPQPVWRRDVHDQYGFFDPNSIVCGDYEFWLRISQTNAFIHINTPLGLYLDCPDSIEHQNQKKKHMENQAISEIYRNAALDNEILGINKHHRVLEEIMDGSTQKNESVFDPSSATHRPENLDAMIQGGDTMDLPKAILNAVEQLIEKDQSNAGCWVLDKFLLEWPDNAKAHHLRATMAFGRKDLEAAFIHFTKAVELEQNDAKYQKSLGDIYFVGRHDAQQAMVHYQKALSIIPDDTETLMTAGHLSVSNHQFDQARYYYRKVLDINPGQHKIEDFLAKLPAEESNILENETSVETLYASAENEIEKGDLDAAIGLLTKVVSMDDVHARAHNDLGVLYYEKGDMEGAQHHYIRACEQEPQNAVYQKNLADFYWVEKNDSQAAMEKYVQTLKLEPQDIEALLGCAQICMAIGKHEDARDFLDCALEIEPWNSDVRQMVGQLDNNVSKGGDPFDSDAVYVEAQTRAANGDIQGAIDDLNGLLHHTPDNALAYNDLGVLYYETGDKEKAMACYEKAYELAPEQPNIIKNLADFYLIEQSMVEESMKLYVKVLEKTPEDIDCLMATATVCTLMGKSEEAIVFYQRVIRLEPWNQDAIQALKKMESDTNATMNTDIKHAIG